MSDGPVWQLVMFDLPVKKASQRREANRFRNDLLDLGFQRVQWSVYVRYSATAAAAGRTSRTIAGCLPAGGDVRILYITDRQWAGAYRYFASEPAEMESEPSSLVLF